MPRHTPVSQLLVEGKEDRHVIWALCGRHELPQSFEVVTPGDEGGGVDELLNGIPVRLKVSGLRALGIVLDADRDPQNRWGSVCHRLKQAGYRNLPEHPHPQGTIVENESLARVGVWLMPNNRVPGILEDFVAGLIPADDALLLKAEHVVVEIERKGLQRYKLTYHAKALIHTWLAWQEIPGRPMGQSITAHSLLHDTAIAMSFIKWLNRLFVL